MSKINRFSETWREVEAHCADRLVSLRGRLEGPLNHEDTVATRAQIREIKQILSLVVIDTPVDTDGVEIAL